MKTCPYDFPVPIKLYGRSLYYEELSKTMLFDSGRSQVDFDTLLHNFILSKYDIICIDHNALGFNTPKALQNNLFCAIRNNKMGNQLFYFSRKDKTYLVRS